MGIETGIDHAYTVALNVDFLEQLLPYFEMHVYTMGTRQYALEVVRILDPDSRYFNGRIVTRDESASAQDKSMVRMTKSFKVGKFLYE